ncbi:craniofacial development protein 2-like [Ostrea edulis]|uniref:craniofacial development protein 2-like n=1 Tax=Ostrea edulis TaxID=37623 RepID=UPI0024AEE55A|nr:craniofacial development protein 2-like [Ostrea edulis]
MTGESSIPIGDVLRPKITRRVGCWNVWTLYQTGKLAQVVREMEYYKIELLGVSEARWTGSGSKQLVSGHQILYSGRTDDHHSKGVAIITTKEVHRSLLEWKPVSERIITARYNSVFAKLTAVVCYAPTDDAEDEEKISFYDSLQKVVDDTPSHDVLLILGDLNAKVGKCNQGKETIMGQQGIGECNNNGERLCTFCQENDLVIGGTIFMHKDIHKTTWNSPDGHTKNQIDHIIINKRWRSSLLDVVAKQGADVGSDHSLVLAKIKLKLRKSRKKDQRPPPINIQKLKDTKTLRSFQLKIQNKFSTLMEHPDEIDMETFNKVLIENSQQILGPKRKKKEEWISDKTWKIVEERKEKKSKILSTKSKRQKDQLQAEYRAIDREVKRSARADRKAYTEKLAYEAEQAASKQDMQTLYRITKTLAGKFQSSELPIKDKRGNVLSKEEDILKRWK